jgi:hypothetical protein
MPPLPSLPPPESSSPHAIEMAAKPSDRQQKAPNRNVAHSIEIPLTSPNYTLND